LGGLINNTQSFLSGLPNKLLVGERIEMKKIRPEGESSPAIVHNFEIMEPDLFTLPFGGKKGPTFLKSLVKSG